MKNKTKIYIIIVFLSLIVIVGIKNINDKKSLNQSITEQNELEQNKHKENKYEWKSDISIDDIIDVDYYFRGFITKSGDLYLYSQNKLFSNEKHYKKVDTEIKFIRFIDTAGVLSNDGKLYYLKNDNSLQVYIYKI